MMSLYGLQFPSAFFSSYFILVLISLQEIAEAYDVLSNPEKKRRYDLGPSAPFRRHSQPSGPGPHFHDFSAFHPIDPFEIFRTFFSGGDPFSAGQTSLGGFRNGKLLL